MLKCLAIDDEPLALRQISAYIAKIPYLELVASCNNALEAQRIASTHAVDLLFVDINMPDLNGVEFVRSLVHRPMIVFTTAYSEYALEGFRLDAIDYLLKPFSFAEFSRSAAKACSLYELQHPQPQPVPAAPAMTAAAAAPAAVPASTSAPASAPLNAPLPPAASIAAVEGSLSSPAGPAAAATSASTQSGAPADASAADGRSGEESGKDAGKEPEKEYLSVKADYKVSLVRIADIVFVESEGEYVRIHLADGSKITTLYRIKNMETTLPADRFMRVHRSYIVNLQRIKSYVRGRVYLNDKDFLPIGENYKESFQQYIEKTYKNL